MSEAPKKIWLYGDIAYIREDLVDELIEALEECLKVKGYKNAREMIQTALAKIKEEENEL